MTDHTRIVALDPDGSQTEITADVLRVWDLVSYDLRYDNYLDIEPEDIDAALRIADACQLSDGPALLAAVTKQREAEAERERRAREWDAMQVARAESHRKVQAQLAAEMREREPALVRAGWTDAELVELHRMRNAGLA